jgi:L-lactate dehydrogenase complex protein LldE
MNDKKTVALFVTCLADLFRPSVAFATIKLLEDAGCQVEVPELQTCCGQPAYNTGAYDETRAVAKQVIEAFADYSWVVAPSGSCAGMLKHHYPKLLKDSPEWRGRAEELAERTWEITSFLSEVAHYHPPQTANNSDGKTYTYHDSCAGLREMGVKQQPRQLLQELKGIELKELEYTEVCCGFGGTFCAKMPEISEKMVDDKLDSALATEADVLLGGDLGCLMNIAGRASRRGQTIEVRHVVEVLADMTENAAIGKSQS